MSTNRPPKRITRLDRAARAASTKTSGTTTYRPYIISRKGNKGQVKPCGHGRRG